MSTKTLNAQANLTLDALADATMAIGHLMSVSASDRLAPADRLTDQALNALTAALDANRAAIRILEATFPEIA